MNFEELALNRALNINNSEEDSQQKFFDNIQKWMDANEQKFVAEVKGDTIELTVMGVIGGSFWDWEGAVTAKNIKKILDTNPNAKNITVLIDSPGGDVFDGIAIHSLLKRSKAEVTVEVIGEASSAASLIAQSASPGKLKMHVGSMMMIHRASNVVRGNSEELRQVADILDTIDEGLLDILEARNKKIDRGTIEGKLRKETWMTAQKAVDEGFADEVLKDVPKDNINVKGIKPKAISETTKIAPSNIVLNVTVNGNANPEQLASELQAELNKAIEGNIMENTSSNTAEVVETTASPLIEGEYTAEEIAAAKATAEELKAKRLRQKREEWLNQVPYRRGFGEKAAPQGGMKAR